jgi:signal transduction histidine kinase
MLYPPPMPFFDISAILEHDGYVIFEEEHLQCERLLKNSLLSSTMLINLINDLLDLAKIENKQFKFNNCFFNLHELMMKTVDTLTL